MAKGPERPLPAGVKISCERSSSKLIFLWGHMSQRPVEAISCTVIVTSSGGILCRVCDTPYSCLQAASGLPYHVADHGLQQPMAAGMGGCQAPMLQWFKVHSTHIGSDHVALFQLHLLELKRLLKVLGLKRHASCQCPSGSWVRWYETEALEWVNTVVWGLFVLRVVTYLRTGGSPLRNTAARLSWTIFLYCVAALDESS